MARLSEADYRGVLEVLGRAAGVDGPVAFPPPVLEALRQLVPCDVIAYHESTPAGRVLVYVGEPRGEMTAEIREAARRLAPEDPLVPAAGARKYSDLFSAREYHRLPIYREACRPLGIEDMLRLWIDPRGTLGARLEFDRADRRFRESNRAALDLLRPHLAQFFRNALARRRSAAPASRALETLTPREREILEHVADGRTNGEIARLLWISPGTVRKHLENAYAKLEVHTRTAAVAVVRARTT